MLTAEHLVECHRDLAHRSAHNAHFREVIAEEAARMPHGVDGELQQSLEGVLEWGMREAYLFQVTADMTPLVAHAAASLDETDRFYRDQAPTECGLLRLEQPAVIHDYLGATVPLHWIAWVPVTFRVTSPGTAAAPAAERIEQATVLYLFNDRYEDIGEFFREVRKTTPVTPEFEEMTERMIGRWFPVGVTVVSDGNECGSVAAMPHDEDYARAVAEGKEVVGGTNVARLVLAAWMLMQQTLVSTTEAPLDRAHRKMAKRMGIPARVTVVMLRRHEGTRREGETYVEWSHRWIVRGHWRWQACGPGRLERRRIWIAPFVKGPDDAPLIVPEKVYRLAH